MSFFALMKTLNGTYPKITTNGDGTTETKMINKIWDNRSHHSHLLFGFWNFNAYFRNLNVCCLNSYHSLKHLILCHISSSHEIPPKIHDFASKKSYKNHLSMALCLDIFMNSWTPHFAPEISGSFPVWVAPKPLLPQWHSFRRELRVLPECTCSGST